MTKKIVIDPVTRVEGHGKVTIHLDEHGKVLESRFHIVEFRGFEKFVQGRPYWEAPVLVQRLCGICPVSHHLAAAKAIDQVVGVDHLTAVAEKMRRLMHYGQIFQSHALHFFYLAAPDLIYGVNSTPEQRNIVCLLNTHKDLAIKGIKLRKFGQEIIKATAGKKIHGISAVPGGIHKNLSLKEKDFFFNGIEVPSIHTCIGWCEEILEFIHHYHLQNSSWMNSFCTFDSNHLSLVGFDGELDLYHGKLRAVNAQGKRILNDVDYMEYLDHFSEEVKQWTYLKFPYLKKLGTQEGWSRVGSLARLNVVDYISTKKAQSWLEKYKALAGSNTVNQSLYYHYARLIEMLHSAELMLDLLNDKDLQNDNLIKKGKRNPIGIGVIEAPRGTLLHHYNVSSKDEITRCNLIVSTTHNNEPMNRAVNIVANNLFDGKEVTEQMLNQIEIAIRCYDPCLSCATHAIGKMPLKVSVYKNDTLISEKVKS